MTQRVVWDLQVWVTIYHDVRYVVTRAPSEIDFLVFYLKIVRTSSFYTYASTTMTNRHALGEYVAHQVTELPKDAAPLLKNQSAEGRDRLHELVLETMKDWVQTSVPSHLSTLRSQTFVSAFSIFEGFLRHLVETYLVQFPQLLMRDDVTLKYHTIVDHATDIMAYLITRELERFDRKDWRHKKKYLVGQLKLNEQGIWGSDKDNLWEQIETTRHRIIHSDQPTDVTNDFLTRCLEYLEGTMFALAAHSQAEHGVPFRFFAESTDVIARKDPPTL